MSKLVCHFQSIEDHYNFGRYNGLTLADVLDINPSYVDWCVHKCDGVHILIDDDAIAQIKKAFPEFDMNEYFINLCHNRFDDYDNDFDDEEYSDECSSYREIESYERYAGTYAQDEMGYSDDDIDTIFDGDPSAYWNID